jgi:hypothetical protein
MPRKTSVRKAADDFLTEVGEIYGFVAQARTLGLGVTFEASVHDYAIIRLHSAFERLMLDALVGVINNDTQALSQTTGVSFPKHLREEVCEYLVTGGGYFDIRGRDGLLKVLQDFIPANSYLVKAVKNPSYKDALERLWALRNFATHRSDEAKARALQAVGAHNMRSAGSWLRIYDRLKRIAQDLQKLAGEIKANAPY